MGAWIGAMVVNYPESVVQGINTLKKPLRFASPALIRTQITWTFVKNADSDLEVLG